jgi:hypothetical protein
MWPKGTASNDFYDVFGYEGLSSQENFIITISLTADPALMTNEAQKL